MAVLWGGSVNETTQLGEVMMESARREEQHKQVQTAEAVERAAALASEEAQEARAVDDEQDTDEQDTQADLERQHSSLVMIDELAGPEDYWLTLTDAARITRRQEVTVRRWVAAGHLPVRRQPMGLTKRTRHVRASDLAQLTPIIDPSAAISDATAHLDLVSIPRQQSQLLAAQQRLTQDLVRVLQRVSELAAEAHILTQQVQILTERQHATDEGIARVIAHAAATHKEMAEQLAQVNAGLGAAQAHSARLADEGQALAARVLQVTGTVEALQQRLDAAEHVLDDVVREMEAAKTAATTQQTKLTALQEQVALHERAHAAQVERITLLESHLAHLLEQHQLHVQQLQQTAAKTDRSAQVQEQHAATLAALSVRMAALEQAREREAAGRRIRSRTYRRRIWHPN